MFLEYKCNNVIYWSRCDIKIILTTGLLDALITAPVLSPSSTCRPCGRVGVVLGQGAPSGIWVRALPSGLRPWRYPGGRGFGFVGRSIGRSVIERGGEGAASRVRLSPVLVRALGRVQSGSCQLYMLVVRAKFALKTSGSSSGQVRVKTSGSSAGQVRVKASGSSAVRV